MPGEPRLSEGLAAAPGALLRIGCSLMGSGKGGQAVAILRKLLSERPGDPEVESAARVILSHGIPSWHSAMLSDAARNDAFESAISRVVTPGATVLDIGTGSGLLAMMAARAGAGRVIACEAHPALAETAREIVEANGLSGTVTVIGKRSTELGRGELGGGADVVIAEVFSDDLLNEGALATLRHAVRELAVPGARIVPRAAAARVALCRFPVSEGSGRVKGFDLSLFRRHVPPMRKVPAQDPRLALRGPACDLFAFGFEDGSAPLAGRTSLELIAGEGGADALVQWIRLELAEGVAYENAPGPEARSHWAVSIHALPGGREVREGESVAVHAAHDGERLQIWF